MDTHVNQNQEEQNEESVNNAQAEKKEVNHHTFQFKESLPDEPPSDQKENTYSNHRTRDTLQLQAMAHNSALTQQAIQLQGMLDNSHRSEQAIQLQAMADNSPRSQQAIQLQAMADNSPRSKQGISLPNSSDNNPRSIAQREQLYSFFEKSTIQKEYKNKQAPVQRKAEASVQRQDSKTASSENKTGLPDRLKSGIEQLSGYSMDDVKVHYNSPKPVQLKALAYTQGTDIHVGPGQQKHLAHEAWHVVQQKQNRVTPTVQMKGLGINDNKGLEREADVMGARAEKAIPSGNSIIQKKAAVDSGNNPPIQMMQITNNDEKNKQFIMGGYTFNIIKRENDTIREEYNYGLIVRNRPIYKYECTLTGAAQNVNTFYFYTDKNSGDVENIELKYYPGFRKQEKNSDGKITSEEKVDSNIPIVIEALENGVIATAMGYVTNTNFPDMDYVIFKPNMRLAMAVSRDKLSSKWQMYYHTYRDLNFPTQQWSKSFIVSSKNRYDRKKNKEKNQMHHIYQHGKRINIDDEPGESVLMLRTYMNNRYGMNNYAVMEYSVYSPFNDTFLGYYLLYAISGGGHSEQKMEKWLKKMEEMYPTYSIKIHWLYTEYEPCGNLNVSDRYRVGSWQETYGDFPVYYSYNYASCSDTEIDPSDLITPERNGGLNDEFLSYDEYMHYAKTHKAMIRKEWSRNKRRKDRRKKEPVGPNTARGFMGKHLMHSPNQFPLELYGHKSIHVINKKKMLIDNDSDSDNGNDMPNNVTTVSNIIIPNSVIGKRVPESNSLWKALDAVGIGTMNGRVENIKDGNGRLWEVTLHGIPKNNSYYTIKALNDDLSASLLDESNIGLLDQNILILINNIRTLENSNNNNNNANPKNLRNQLMQAITDSGNKISPLIRYYAYQFLQGNNLPPQNPYFKAPKVRREQKSKSPTPPNNSNNKFDKNGSNGSSPNKNNGNGNNSFPPPKNDKNSKQNNSSNSSQSNNYGNQSQYQQYGSSSNWNFNSNKPKSPQYGFPSNVNFNDPSWTKFVNLLSKVKPTQDNDNSSNTNTNLNTNTNKTSKKVERHSPSNIFANIGNLRSFYLDKKYILKNDGGGNCLYYALTCKKNLDSNTLKNFRLKVAKVRENDPNENQSINAMNIANTLYETFNLDSGVFVNSLLEGKHNIPNSVYAALQAVPGIFAGEPELQQLCNLENIKAVAIYNTWEVKYFHPINNQNNTPAPQGQTFNNIQELLPLIRGYKVVLYKTPGHWERVLEKVLVPDLEQLRSNQSRQQNTSNTHQSQQQNSTWKQQNTKPPSYKQQQTKNKTRSVGFTLKNLSIPIQSNKKMTFVSGQEAQQILQMLKQLKYIVYEGVVFRDASGKLFEIKSHLYGSFTLMLVN